MPYDVDARLDAIARLLPHGDEQPAKAITKGEIKPVGKQDGPSCPIHVRGLMVAGASLILIFALLNTCLTNLLISMNEVFMNHETRKLLWGLTTQLLDLAFLFVFLKVFLLAACYYSPGFIPWCREVDLYLQHHTEMKSKEAKQPQSNNLHSTSTSMKGTKKGNKTDNKDVIESLEYQEDAKRITKEDGEKADGKMPLTIAHNNRLTKPNQNDAFTGLNKDSKRRVSEILAVIVVKVAQEILLIDEMEDHARDLVEQPTPEEMEIAFRIAEGVHIRDLVVEYLQKQQEREKLQQEKVPGENLQEGTAADNTLFDDKDTVLVSANHDAEIKEEEGTD
ncbi:MAG: hypothetical protein Q9220_001118 [cf. Caloplaca sp. 1 TL-2023]